MWLYAIRWPAVPSRHSEWHLCAALTRPPMQCFVARNPNHSLIGFSYLFLVLTITSNHEEKSWAFLQTVLWKCSPSTRTNFENECFLSCWQISVFSLKCSFYEVDKTVGTCSHNFLHKLLISWGVDQQMALMPRFMFKIENSNLRASSNVECLWVLTSATPGFLSQRSQLVGGGGLNTKVYYTHSLVSGGLYTKVYYTLNTV